MSLLLETTVGNVTIDLDTDGSPQLVRNVLKLAKCRYYTNTLIYNVQPHRLCQLGDPRGDGTGGCSIFGLIDAVRSDLGDVRQSRRRFLKSEGRALTAAELCERGRLVASEIGGVRDTVGSQLILTVDGGRSGEGLALDGLVELGSGGGDAAASAAASTTADGQQGRYLSVGVVVEDDDDVLGKINGLYCDANGRPYADVRIIRAHVLDDPFDDPDGLEDVLDARGVKLEPPAGSNGNAAAPRLATASPAWERPPEEIVERRIGADVALAEDDANIDAEEQEEALRKKEDKSRAVVLEMLGDLPTADIAAPDNVLFVCKLNPVTDDEDLELIFSRFDPNARAEIIRDPDTGDSLCYAFVEFTTKEQCNEAYFKMNNALVDDRRIKVDFSQSVAKVWNKYTQRKRGGAGAGGRHNGIERGRGMGRGGQGGAGGGFGPGGGRDIRGSSDGPPQRRWEPPHSRSNGHGRYHQPKPQKATDTPGHSHHHHKSDDARYDRKVEDRLHNDDRTERRRHGGQGDDRRRSRSRSRERGDKQGRGHRSPPHRRHRSRSRSHSRDRKRRHHRKDHKARDRHGSRGDDHGNDRRRERKHESKKKRHHKRSRSRSEDRDRKKASRKHVSSGRNRSRS